MGNPLVSVAVITYNSSKYVLETLESAKSQTYQNIELVISDDCSTDDTVKLCKEWIEQNKQRFARVQIVESGKNTGVSANCNRAEDACKGEWVKLIAGDDILLQNCINDYVEYVKYNPKAWNVFARVELFGDSISETKQIESDKWFDSQLSKFPIQNAKKQNKYIKEAGCRGNGCLLAPTYFYNRRLKKVISYDESIPLIEDLPRWILLTQKGYDMYIIDKKTVKYRIHSHSIVNGKKTAAILMSFGMLYTKYLFWTDLKLYPRGAILKLIKVKQYLTSSLLWSFSEKIFRFVEKIYCIILRKDVCSYKDIHMSIEFTKTK